MSDKELDYYYKTKAKYQKIINKKIKEIMDEDLSEKEKRQMFNSYKPKCIKCKREGGTIFENKNKKLTIICGVKDPCKLNIEIDKEEYFNVRNEDIKLYNKVKNLKSDIICIKLDLLYKYDNQEKLLEKFQEIKNQLFITTKYLLNIRKEYINIINNQEKSNSLNIILNKYNEIILELKELKNQYIDDQNDSLIKTIIEKYFIELQPLVKKIRDNKYLYSEIKTIEKKINLANKVKLYELVQKPYSIGDLYIPII